MNYLQIPYDDVQTYNALWNEKMCKPIDMNKDEVQLLLKILSYLKLDTYNWKNPEHMLNKILSIYGNINMNEFCSEMPDLCDMINFSAKEIGIISELSLTDFQNLVCSIKLKTTCQKGDKNCNVASNPSDIAKSFCNSTCSSKNYKQFFENYINQPYNERYDVAFNYLCKHTCNK